MEKSLVELANILRRDYGLITYADLNDEVVKVLEADSDNWRSIVDLTEIGDKEGFAVGREGGDLLTKEVYDFISDHQSSSEIVGTDLEIAFFCDDLSKNCRVSQIYYEESGIVFFGKECKNKMEVILALSEMMIEEKRKANRPAPDFDKQVIANGLRKKYGMICYTLGSKERTVVVAATVDQSEEVRTLEAEPGANTIGQFLLHQKGSVESLTHMDIYMDFFDKCFEGIASEESKAMSLCERISEYVKIGEIYYEDDSYKVLGRTYPDKDSLLEALPVLVREVQSKESKKSLSAVADLAYSVEWVQNDKAVILDGVAYLADSSSTMMAKEGTFYVEGYLANGKVIWSKVDTTKYKAVKASRADKSGEQEIEIHILETLYYSDLYIVYRSIVKGEEHVIRSPYPVAILEDGAFAFYFENENAEAKPSVEKWLDKWRKSKEA